MRELTQKKRLEIIRLFLNGDTFDRISTEADVGKGSVVNVVNELKAGRFPTLADVAELAEALRELSVEMKKKNIGVSQAVLGITFFSRLTELGIPPDKLSSWVDMCRKISPADTPLEEFTTAALELLRLSRETGESYESTAARWSKLRAEAGSLGRDVKNLDLKKKESETKLTALGSDYQRLSKEKQGLENNIKTKSIRCEALKKETNQLEASRHQLNKQVAELDDKVKALRPAAKELERLGFRKDELEKLKTNLKKIASDQSLTPEQLTAGFFQSLDEYQGILGLDKKKKRLMEEVAALQTQKESLEHSLSRLGLPTDEAEEAIKSLASLKKKGISHQTVVSYCKVLSQTGLQPNQLEKEALELGGLGKAIASRKKELRELAVEERKLVKVVDTLHAEEVGIKTTIRDLKESGIKEVKEVSLAVIREVRRADQAFLEDISKWGDIKVKTGKFEEELKLARYFGRLPLANEAVAALIEELPAVVVSQYLNIILAWCLKKFNPKLKPPRFITTKYFSISEYGEVELIDLLAWVLAVFTEGGAYGNK